MTASTADDGGSTPSAVLDSYRPGLVVVAAFAVAGLLLVLTGVRGRPRARHSIVVAKGEPGAVRDTEPERVRSLTE